MNKSLYTPSDLPDPAEKQEMWSQISESIDQKKSPIISLHWRSFWVGNAAAILIGFALVGLFNTVQALIYDDQSIPVNDQMYQTLTSATDQLKDITPMLIAQASEPRKMSIESTAMAIEEIDRLINEIRDDMLINGVTPIKQHNLKRLYATKLDFYKDLLLKEDNES